jgi:hypothetical protein
MSLPSWDDDEALLAELRTALAEPATVPAEFTAAARGALAWRTVDTDLLELAFDSALDAELAVRSPAATSTRLLTFDGVGVRVEAEVSGAGIVGQLTPADGGRVSCQTATGTFDEASIDELGCFVLRSPGNGPVRLRLSSAGRSVATTWVRLP